MEDHEREEPIQIRVNGAELEGLLAVPPGARGIVLFAHGSGSSRHSPRNQFVARFLRRERLGTLLFDLLCPREADRRDKVFDIRLLAERLQAARAYVRQCMEVGGLPVGNFGASTGAAAALLQPAGDRGIRAIVSRCGRPDLARDALERVTAPTLLIVGARDAWVLEVNRRAFEELQCVKELRVVAGAGHLFEEPGALDEVARLAREWFCRHLTAGREGDHA